MTPDQSEIVKQIERSRDQLAIVLASLRENGNSIQQYLARQSLRDIASLIEELKRG